MANEERTKTNLNEPDAGAEVHSAWAPLVRASHPAAATTARQRWRPRPDVQPTRHRFGSPNATICVPVRLGRNGAPRARGTVAQTLPGSESASRVM